MSAFLVGNDHIDYLVTAIRSYRDITTAYIPAPDGIGVEAIKVEYMDDTDMGRMLLGTNLTSLMDRYRDSLTFDEMEAPSRYTYKRWTGPMSPVQTIKAVTCFQYQSNEYDGWKDSLAKSLTDLLTSEAISALPGYEAAAWEVTRES